MDPSDTIYLDHNATTPLAPEVAAAMAESQATVVGNPASQHAAGRRARAVLEDARERIGRMLGADVDAHRPDRVILTSGATEANNLALHGLGGRNERPVYISAIEHPSVVGPADELARSGVAVERLGVTREGILDLAAAAERIESGARLVSVMLGNNDTGILQPIERLAELGRERGVLVHTDAVQAVGKIEVDFRRLGVDALSASAHKFHGPVGVGLLIVRSGVELEPLHLGGFQQQGLRAGTESVVLAVGLCRALELWRAEHDERLERMTGLRERLERGLRTAWPAVVIHGSTVARLPHTTCASFVGLDRQALAMAFDLAGIACSTGSACASGSTDPSPALVAAGVPEEQTSSALRFSVGASTTAAEIDAALEKIGQICRQNQPLFEGRKMAATARPLGRIPV